MLHGPNGSTKTSSVEALANAMSHTVDDAGMVFHFNWVFPRVKVFIL